MRALEVEPVRPGPADRGAGGGTLIRRGAELVHLGEELHVRMLALALLLLGASGAFSVPLAEANSLEMARPLTILFSALAIVAAAWGLARRRALYLWLRRGRARQLAPGLLAAAIVLVDSPYSPCWWIASALLLCAAVVGEGRSSLIVGTLTAAAYAAGTLLHGASLLPAGDSEYLAVTASLLINPPIARALIEGFARFLLHLHRLEEEVAVAARQPAPSAARQPALPAALVAGVRIGTGDEDGVGVGEAPAMDVVTADTGADPVREDGPDAAGQAPGEQDAPSLPRRRGASRLTVRQLEVALLARDGLRQAEIAAALGISIRQVERHLEEGRRRAGAVTTAHLIALLVNDDLAPPKN